MLPGSVVVCPCYGGHLNCQFKGTQGDVEAHYRSVHQPVPWSPIRPGEQIIKQGVFVYRCPVCKVRRDYDDMYGPACTGPSDTRDEHPMTPMRLVGRT